MLSVDKEQGIEIAGSKEDVLAEFTWLCRKLVEQHIFSEIDFCQSIKLAFKSMTDVNTMLDDDTLRADFMMKVVEMATMV